MEKANIIANKINKKIAENRKNALCNASTNDVGKLWALLRKTENWGSKNSKLNCCGNVNNVNKYITSVVSDKEYSREAVLSELHSQLAADNSNSCLLYTSPSPRDS